MINILDNNTEYVTLVHRWLGPREGGYVSIRGCFIEGLEDIEPW